MYLRSLTLALTLSLSYIHSPLLFTKTIWVFQYSLHFLIQAGQRSGLLGKETEESCVKTAATFIHSTTFPECLLCTRTFPDATGDTRMSQRSLPTELLLHLGREIPGRESKWASACGMTLTDGQWLPARAVLSRTLRPYLGLGQ